MRTGPKPLPAEGEAVLRKASHEADRWQRLAGGLCFSSAPMMTISSRTVPALGFRA